MLPIVSKINTSLDSWQGLHSYPQSKSSVTDQRLKELMGIQK